MALQLFSHKHKRFRDIEYSTSVARSALGILMKNTRMTTSYLNIFKPFHYRYAYGNVISCVHVTHLNITAPAQEVSLPSLSRAHYTLSETQSVELKVLNCIFLYYSAWLAIIGMHAVIFSAYLIVLKITKDDAIDDWNKV